MPTSTGKRVKSAREEAGLTQHALARAAGHSRPSIARIEAGHLPTLRMALDVASALDRTVDDLFGYEPDGNKRPRAAATAGGMTTSEEADAVQRAAAAADGVGRALANSGNAQESWHCGARSRIRVKAAPPRPGAGGAACHQTVARVQAEPSE